MLVLLLLLLLPLPLLLLLLSRYGKQTLATICDCRTKAKKFESAITCLRQSSTTFMPISCIVKMSDDNVNIDKMTMFP